MKIKKSRNKNEAQLASVEESVKTQKLRLQANSVFQRGTRYTNIICHNVELQLHKIHIY